MSEDRVLTFGVAEANELGNPLVSRGVLSDEEAGTLALALLHISESVEKLYFSLVPHLLSEQEASPERMKEVLWDIREEFRHIDYHIHDAELTVL